jgi:1,4-dihydroxy-2-naphthoate octaprenyltransferase
LDSKVLLGPMRVPFLLLDPACVALGAATAYWGTGSMNALHLILVLIGAIAAHIAVNALNEYFDYRSGLDLRTRRTPFSGGSGTLPAEPKMERPALIEGLLGMAVAAAIGIYFLIVIGPALLPLGLLGLVVIYVYTVWLTRNPVLCLAAPGVGFGLLMVMGTDFVLRGGSYSWSGFWASLVPTFLVSNLLLLNQFPDVEADTTIGRKHFPIVIGRRKSSLIYGAFLALTYVSIVIGVVLGALPWPALLGLLTVPLAVKAGRGAYRYADDIPNLIPFMGANVQITLITPALMAIGIFIAGLLAW